MGELAQVPHYPEEVTPPGWLSAPRLILSGSGRVDIYTHATEVSPAAGPAVSAEAAG